MSSDLRLDWCSHEAAKYAVEKWHYSHRMPMPPMVTIGAWEDSRYIGAVVFNRGANMHLYSPYGLSQTEGAELSRVALSKHKASVTRVVAISIRKLRSIAPGLRLVVSFADPEQGHVGAIYQAGNWIYAGVSASSRQYLHEGRWKHSREVTSGAFGSARVLADYKSLPTRETQPKHRYLMPLDDEMRARVAPLAKPYPKRVRPSGADEHHSPAGGVAPTRTLHSAGVCA